QNRFPKFQENSVVFFFDNWYSVRGHKRFDPRHLNFHYPKLSVFFRWYICSSIRYFSIRMNWDRPSWHNQKSFFLLNPKAFWSFLFFRATAYPLPCEDDGVFRPYKRPPCPMYLP